MRQEDNDEENEVERTEVVARQRERESFSPRLDKLVLEEGALVELPHFAFLLPFVLPAFLLLMLQKSISLRSPQKKEGPSLRLLLVPLSFLFAVQKNLLQASSDASSINLEGEKERKEALGLDEESEGTRRGGGLG